MVAVFERKEEDVIITVYPCEESEIKARLDKRRWIYEKVKN